MPRTRFAKFAGKINDSRPTTPGTGEVLRDGNYFMMYNGTNWVGIAMTTSTSTTTSTTTS